MSATAVASSGPRSIGLVARHSVAGVGGSHGPNVHAPSAHRASPRDTPVCGEPVRWHRHAAAASASCHVAEVAFDLPAAALAADREEETWLVRKELNAHVEKAVRQWGKTLKGVKVQVVGDGGALDLRVSGTGDVRGALREASGVVESATDEWLGAHRFTRLDDGSVSFDHATLVTDYDDDLRPVAEALRAGTTGDREFVERALSFVQSIPYEARKRKGGDPGYRRPLALLSRNRGDCDSKSVLFLAIVHAELPAVPLSVVYVPGHALVGVGLPKESGDRSFSSEGIKYLYAEPVGPAQLPLGEVGKGHTRGREVRAVP